MIVSTTDIKHETIFCDQLFPVISTFHPRSVRTCRTPRESAHIGGVAGRVGGEQQLHDSVLLQLLLHVVQVLEVAREVAVAEVTELVFHLDRMV